MRNDVDDSEPMRAPLGALLAAVTVLLVLLEQWLTAVGASAAALSAYWILGPWGRPR